MTENHLQSWTFRHCVFIPPGEASTIGAQFTFSDSDPTYCDELPGRDYPLADVRVEQGLLLEAHTKVTFTCLSTSHGLAETTGFTGMGSFGHDNEHFVAASFHCHTSLRASSLSIFR